MYLNVRLGRVRVKAPQQGRDDSPRLLRHHPATGGTNSSANPSPCNARRKGTPPRAGPCASAGGAPAITRPGVVRALGHKTAPDRTVTAFAGMERDAVERVRALAASVPPSSPCAYLFKDGVLVAALQRREIEGRSPELIAGALTAMFDAHCAKAAARA